jgi:hypothetical protein
VASGSRGLSFWIEGKAIELPLGGPVGGVIKGERFWKCKEMSWDFEVLLEP